MNSCIRSVFLFDIQRTFTLYPGDQKSTFSFFFVYKIFYSYIRFTGWHKPRHNVCQFYIRIIWDSSTQNWNEIVKEQKSKRKNTCSIHRTIMMSTKNVLCRLFIGPFHLFSYSFSITRKLSKAQEQRSHIILFLWWKWKKKKKWKAWRMTKTHKLDKTLEMKKNGF